MFNCSGIKNYYINRDIRGECGFRAFRGLKSRSFFRSSLDKRINQSALEILKKSLFTIGVITVGFLALATGVLLKTVSYPEYVSSRKKYLCKEYNFYCREYSELCTKENEDFIRINEEQNSITRKLQAEIKEKDVKIKKLLLENQRLGCSYTHNTDSDFLESRAEKKKPKDKMKLHYSWLLENYPSIDDWSFSARSIKSIEECIDRIKSVYIARLEHHNEFVFLHRALYINHTLL